MFHCCRTLNSINVSKFNTNNVINMYGMFLGTNLRVLNLSNFNVDNVTDMEKMFGINNIKEEELIRSQIKNIKDEAFFRPNDDSSSSESD